MPVRATPTSRDQSPVRGAPPRYVLRLTRVPCPARTRPRVPRRTALLRLPSPESASSRCAVSGLGLGRDFHRRRTQSGRAAVAEAGGRCGNPRQRDPWPGSRTGNTPTPSPPTSPCFTQSSPTRRCPLALPNFHRFNSTFPTQPRAWQFERHLVVTVHASSVSLPSRVTFPSFPW
eukprot:358814-Chlamydomonas_euryale.AAC.6